MRSSIINKLQRTSASKEIGYQNLKIDEPPGSLEANHSGDPAASASPERSNPHSVSNSVSPPPPSNRSSSRWFVRPASSGPSSRPRRIPRWCRCICWLCCILFVLLLLAGIAAGCFYLIVRPRAPKFSLDDVGVSSLLLTITNNNASLGDYEFNSVLDLDLLLTINAYNPNTNILVYYDKIRVDVLYGNLQLASTYIEPFVQGHRERRVVTAEMLGNPSLQKFVSRSLSGEISVDVVNLQVEISAKGKVKVVKTLSPSVVAHLFCNLQVSPPTGPNGPRLLYKSCKVSKPYSTRSI